MEIPPYAPRDRVEEAPRAGVRADCFVEASLVGGSMPLGLRDPGAYVQSGATP